METSHGKGNNLSGGIETKHFNMNQSQSKAYIALAFVCIVWGTTYIFLLIGVTTIPPFLFSGIRQTVAGLILLTFLGFSGKLGTLDKKSVSRAAIPGILMLALGNGVVGWSEQYIPSGLAALILSIMPIYIVIITFLSGADRQRPSNRVLLGLLTGSFGIFLMFKDNLSDFTNPGYFAGMLVAFAAALSWAAGSVLVKYKPPGTDILTNAALQMVSGGVFLLIMSLASENYSNLDKVSSDSMLSLLYLIVIGSLISYPCFVYALQQLPVGISSIYAYINPFIALLLGYLFLDEKITWITALALITALAGVYFINSGYKPGTPKPVPVKSN